MILRMLPGPFLGWLGVLMFLLIMQFLIKYLPDLAGKGLSPWVIAELVAYSLAYMVVLAVPMAILLAMLMTFGQLSESNAYAVIKSSGISPLQLIWPALIVGLFVTGGMTYFNNIVLPEANFRARNLWQDIRTKKPGFELQPGVFYDGLNDYSILVKDRPPDSNTLEDITIYDYTGNTYRQTVIKAEHGQLETKAGGSAVELTLFDGEVHRTRTGPRGDRYERLAFGRHQLMLDLSDFAFERNEPRDGHRSDRTMPTPMMVQLIDSLRSVAAQEQAKLHQLADSLNRMPAGGTERQEQAEPPAQLPATQTSLPADSAAQDSSARVALAGLDPGQRASVYSNALRSVRSMRSDIEDTDQEIRWKNQRADRYLVEVYKKYSIAVACLIFVLIGAPLGLSIRRGGLATVGGLALGIFLFYWVTLVQGEKLADRGHIDPWIGMWAANAVMLVVGLWLMVYTTLDLRATPPLRTRLWQWIRRKIRI